MDIKKQGQSRVIGMNAAAHCHGKVHSP